VWAIKEVEMRKIMLLLTTTAAILACGAIAASAQAPAAPATDHEMGYGMPATRSIPGGSTMQQKLRDHVQSGEDEDSEDHDSWHRYHGAMMGMMGRGLMGRGLMMRMIFSVMDADSDGTLSLQEFQAASERIFKAMDTDHDGTVTLQEMQDFIHGTSRPAQ
jgi:EF hand